MVKEIIANFTIDNNEQNVEFELNDDANIDANFDVVKNEINATFNINECIDKYFAFEQGISSNTWTIQHNLNKHPSITIVDEYERVIPGFAAEYIDNNTVIVSFNAAFKGKAYLN